MKLGVEIRTLRELERRLRDRAGRARTICRLEALTAAAAAVRRMMKKKKTGTQR